MFDIVHRQVEGVLLVLYARLMLHHVQLYILAANAESLLHLQFVEVFGVTIDLLKELFV